MGVSFRAAVASILAAAALVGCAGIDYSSMSAAEIYSLGESHFEKKEWRDAQEAFEKLKEVHPFSLKVTPAELRIAECMYRKREYAEAIVAFQEWLDRHPTNAEVPRAVYFLGLANYDQRLSIDRDQTFTQEANRQFARLVAQHRGSEYAAQAQDKLADTRTRLAKREWYVGRFYWRQREYYSALGRYLTILKDYPDTKFEEEALFQAARCYLRLSDRERARPLLETLLSRYPNGRFAGRARSLLAEGAGS